MYEVKIVTGFAAAHQLREIQGKCESLHGHNWKIEVCVAANKLDNAGVAIDFRVLKQHVNDILDDLDHKFLNQLPAFEEKNPSSENIATYVAEQLASRLAGQNLRVSRVTAWESENACASYCPQQ